MGDEDYVCEAEGCNKKVAKSSRGVCDKYPELKGKYYCPTHRDALLKTLGYWCAICNMKRTVPGETICYDCKKNGGTPTQGMTDLLAVPDSNISYPVVRPAVDTATALATWKAFQELKQKIKTKDDVVSIKGNEYLTKSFWRKMATFFNLSNRIVKKEEKTDSKGRMTAVYYEVEVSAPNGRTTIGVGVCSRFERAFAHADHDVTAMAHVRALNRAISDMIAGGQTSAEEMGEEYKIED